MKRFATMGLAAILASTSVANAAEPATEPKVEAAKTPTKEAVAEAKVRFERGTALYQDGDYKLALIEFRRAYDLAPSYKMLYNIGQVELQISSFAAARRSLERYLSDGGKEIPAKRRASVEKDLLALKARTAHVEVTTIEGAELTIDGTKQGKAPIASILVDAGEHKISVTKEGYEPFQKDVTLAGGDEEKVQADLKPIPPPTVAPAVADSGGAAHAPGPLPAPTAEPQPANYLWVGWVGTGALVAGATVTGILALSAKSDLEDKLGAAAVPSDVSDAKSNARTMGIVTDVLAGAAIVTAGVTLYFTLKRDPSPKRGQNAPSLAVGPTSVGFAGSF